MSAGIIAQIAQVVSTHARRHPRGRAAIGSYVEGELLPFLAPRFPGVDAGRIELIAVMILLGPPSAGPPTPAGLRQVEDLFGRRQVSGAPANRSARRALIDAAIGVGCGHGRSVDPASTGWKGIWPGAIVEIRRRVHAVVRRAMRTIEGGVHGFHPPSERDLRSAADYISGRFIGGAPAGGPRYRYFQALASWDPNLGSLDSWIERAVLGFPIQPGGIQANRLRNGLLYGWLRDEHLIAIRAIALRHCGLCGSVAEYNPVHCLRCRRRPAVERSRVAAKVVLVAPSAYSPMEFRSCRGRCAHSPPGIRPGAASFYPPRLPRCPRCAGPLSQRVTHLWVRARWIG